MKYVNKVALTGRAGRDAETNYTAGGLAVTKFSLAQGGGKKKEGGVWPTHWFDVVAFDHEQAQAVTKGASLEIVGRLSTSSWTDKETGKKRTKVEIIAESVELAETDANVPAKVSPSLEIEEADIPF